MAEILAAIDRPVRSTLSEREFEILLRIGAGQTSKEIANQLSIATSPLETYRERIKLKLGLKSGGELIRFAVLYSIAQSAKEEPQPSPLKIGGPESKEEDETNERPQLL